MEERRQRIESYREPPAEVTAIVDAPPTPIVRLSPDRSLLLHAAYHALPPIETLAEPLLRLAGLRFHPHLDESQRTYHFTRFTLQRLADGVEWPIETPPGAELGWPVFAPDGRHLAFTVSTRHGAELWVAGTADGRARRATSARLNAVLGGAAGFCGDDALLVRLVPENRGEPPAPPAVPRGPRVEDTRGRAAKNRTFQDLLEDEQGERLLEHHLATQLARLALDGSFEPVGEPGLLLDVTPSPDGRFLLVERTRRPFSFAVPLSLFARVVEVWDTRGRVLAQVADLPVMDEVPIQGVPIGPRAVDWAHGAPATLFWAEALDGGDPERKVEHRDRLLLHDAPFAPGGAREVARVAQRFVGVDWFEGGYRGLVTEWDRDRRWVTTRLHDFAAPRDAPRVIFDRSIHDRYGDPGQPVPRRTRAGALVVDDEDGWIWLAGDGATPEGDRPFLDRMHLATGERERLYQSGADEHAPFVALTALGAGRERAFVVRRESRVAPPNYVLVRSAAGKPDERALTRYADPHPQLTGIHKEVVTYRRKDGVELSGTLYLPPGRSPGAPLPLLLWPYPQEYNDPATAGQVRAQPQRFTRLGGTSPLMFLLQGIAVLDDPGMPVVGDPEVANDTFVEQMVASAEAAIDCLAERGLVDRERVAIGGHSYGAYLVATLLAHSRLFRAGIARSGAYNRTLTPYGFQNERRTLWQARDVYVKLSPYLYAEGVRAPLLLIHGERDENAGTHPMQSRRLFQALEGLGGTARLVVLPLEGHGYAARESVLHVLAECFDFLNVHLLEARDDK